jgi:hypothetical protein
MKKKPEPVDQDVGMKTGLEAVTELRDVLHVARLQLKGPVLDRFWDVIEEVWKKRPKERR